MSHGFLNCFSFLRLSSVSIAPPSEKEQQRESEIETCRVNQASEPERNVEVPQERVCDSPVLLQEPPELCIEEHCVNASPYTSLETKHVEEKLNLTSNYETHSLHPQDNFILDNNPPECTPPSLGVGSNGHEPRTLQELAEICPRPLPHLEITINQNRGSSACLKSPEQHQEDPMNDLPSCAQLTENEQTPLADAMSRSASFHYLSLTTEISDGVNPRKRSRSFTLSPKASKMRRTTLWSDPTDQNSGVGIRFDLIQQNVINASTEANDTERKLETAEQDPLPDVFLASNAVPVDQKDEPVSQMYPNDDTCSVSSELGPPQLYPFFHDDIYQNQATFLDPPKLTPTVPVPSINKAFSTSLLSQSCSSVCIESAFVPDTFSPASSESDWDSGLLSRLAPPVHLQPKGGRCELDLGLLLQSSCAEVQDGSYASHLCSVLQPTSSSLHTGFGEANTIYRPIETMDRRIIQGLGV